MTVRGERLGVDRIPPRVAYLQHATDPVTWFTPSILHQRPEWLEEPRCPDVSPAMPYVPVVTFVQVAVDTVFGASAPVGHGHIYGPAQAAGRALVGPPADWAAADTERLLRRLRA
jgi:uncharacterized membrane protein